MRLGENTGCSGVSCLQDQSVVKSRVIIASYQSDRIDSSIL